MQTVYEYIFFKEVDKEAIIPARKTRVYGVFNKNDKMLLGWVTWHNAWRQYTYEINTASIRLAAQADVITSLSAGCLRDIANFIAQLNYSHTLELINRKKEINNE